jgi:hypothetical protein
MRYVLMDTEATPEEYAELDSMIQAEEDEQDFHFDSWSDRDLAVEWGGLDVPS